MTASFKNQVNLSAYARHINPAASISSTGTMKMALSVARGRLNNFYSKLQIISFPPPEVAL